VGGDDDGVSRIGTRRASTRRTVSRDFDAFLPRFILECLVISWDGADPPRWLLPKDPARHVRGHHPGLSDFPVCGGAHCAASGERPLQSLPHNQTLPW